MEKTKGLSIPRTTTPKGQKIRVGNRVVRVGPGTVPVKPQKSGREVLEILKKAAKRRVFPFPQVNA